MATATLLGLTLTLSPPLLTTLRLAPLLSSTASLTHAYMEYITTSAFYRQPPLTTAPFSTTVQPSSPTPAQTKAYTDRVKRANDVALPAWFTQFFNTGLYSVVGFNFLTTSSALVNLLVFPSGLGASGKRWYWGGFVAGVAHMGFVPLVAGAVAGLIKLAIAQESGGVEKVEGKEVGRAQGLMKEWVGAHVIRMATVDVAAWVAFAVGAVGVLT